MVAVPRADGKGTTCIDSTEVTRAQYQQFLDSATVGTYGSQDAFCQWNDDFVPDATCTASYHVSSSCGDCPIVCVDWCDAAAYCRWAGKRLWWPPAGGPSSYDKYLNPHHSQWSNACSAGSTFSGPTQAFPYGKTFDSVCNEQDATSCDPDDPSATNICAPAVVKSFPGCVTSGAYAGLYDMVGNVWEWENACADSTGKNDNCALRGGSYFDSKDKCRCSEWVQNPRFIQHYNIGFRCCGD